MHHLIYMSRATTPLSAQALVDLLRQAQAANNKAGLTGLLVYHDGRFMQVLEGEQAAVLATYERIARDPRHRDVCRLADKPIAERSFLAWSMTFQEVGAVQFEHLTQLAGYVPPQLLQHLTFAGSPADDTLLNQLRELAHPAAQAPVTD